MNITKRHIEELEGCYAVSALEIDKKLHAFFATELIGPCVAYDIPSFEKKEAVWMEPGGCMSILSIPGRENEYIAIQQFYEFWKWEKAKLVWLKRKAAGDYEAKTLASIPCVHRFDCLTNDAGDVYLVACRVAEHKSYGADWSQPGFVYAAKLPENLSEDIELQTIYSGIHQNHGYARICWNGKEAGLITCKKGGFVFTPPQSDCAEWKIEKILDTPISDADAIDIDGDGELEIATIEEFHGKYFRIYKKISGEYRMVYEYPEIADFYHVVKAGMIHGKPSFVGGGRGGKQQLFIIQQENGAFNATVVDEGEGPSNAAIVNLPDCDLILAANRNTGKATAYEIK